MKVLALSACATMLVMALGVAEAAPQKKIDLPLQRNTDYKPSAKNAVQKALAKYSKANKNATGARMKTGTVPMTDYENDIEYYGVVEVGTPPQKLKLDFDTGSSDMWFASTLCSSCSSHTQFDSSKSSTYAADGRAWSIQYGDGSTASGILGTDTVNLGGLTIAKQTIELAKTESSSFNSGPIDGLLGLGFDSITTVSGVKTPMDNLISQGLISSPVFGVYLGKQSNGGGGEYIFGGYNKDHINGTLTTIPIDNSQGFWGVTVSSVKEGSKSVASSFSAILDTGTTLLLLPQAVSDKVASAYGAKDNGDGTYTINCDTSSFEPLVFTIGGGTFEVPVDSLIFEQDGSTCYAGFGYGLDFAILGDVFLKNNYVVFNQKVPEVQIAPAK